MGGNEEKLERKYKKKPWKNIEGGLLTRIIINQCTA
jgi:hypothetical protein